MVSRAIRASSTRPPSMRIKATHRQPHRMPQARSRRGDARGFGEYDDTTSPAAPAQLSRGDEEHIVAVWNAALLSDPIKPTTWRAAVLLDPNFDPDGCLVVEVGERVCGLLLTLTRHAALERDRSRRAPP